MARLNEVRLFGCVADTPKIVKRNEDGSYVRGLFHLATVRSTRYSGETFGEKDRILYDWPIILSTDPEIISAMDKLRQYDMVDIRGAFVTRKIKKITYCKHCGARNEVDGNICYVLPRYFKRRNTEADRYTEKRAAAEVAAEREVSNSIHIIGNLCNDVNYYHSSGNGITIQTSVYQIATNRKLIVREDSPDIRADFPMIRSYGKNAYKDSLCLRKGSLIMVDGFLHSREFERNSICSECGEEYQWNDNTIEIVPYDTEYLANYTDPEEAEKAAANRVADEGDDLLKDLMT